MRDWLQLSLLALLVLALTAGVAAQEDDRTGRLEMINVPADALSGHFEAKSGVFRADVSEYPDATVKLTYQDTEVTGPVLVWHTKDDYFHMSGGVRAVQEDMELASEELEYFGEEKKMVAQGQVRVVTEDAEITSDQMTYYEEEDKAYFLGNVVVALEDGTVRGEQFVMFLETEEMQFVGPFQGEFTATE